MNLICNFFPYYYIYNIYIFSAYFYPSPPSLQKQRIFHSKITSYSTQYAVYNIRCKNTKSYNTFYILSVKKHNFTLGFCSHTHVSISVLRFLVTNSLTIRTLIDENKYNRQKNRQSLFNFYTKQIFDTYTIEIYTL